MMLAAISKWVLNMLHTKWRIKDPSHYAYWGYLETVPPIPQGNAFSARIFKEGVIKSIPQRLKIGDDYSINSQTTHQSNGVLCLKKKFVQLLGCMMRT